MAVALEGIAEGAAIVLLCLVVILLGLAGVIRAVCDILANHIPTFSILGHDLTSWIRHGLRAGGDALYSWMLTWYHAQVRVVVVLWHGITWSITETIDGIVDAYDAATHAVSRVVLHIIPAAIADLKEFLLARIHALRVTAEGWYHDALSRVHDLRRDFGAFAASVPGLLRTAIHRFNVDVVQPIRRDLSVVEHAVAGEIRPLLHRVRDAVNALHAEIAAGVGYAEDILPRLPHIGFDDLSDYIDRVPWRRLGGLLGLGFLTHALLKALVREAGLDRAECRGKVKGICGTHSGAWENLLAGLVGGIALAEFDELVNVAETIIEELTDDFLDYAGTNR